MRIKRTVIVYKDIHLYVNNAAFLNTCLGLSSIFRFSLFFIFLCPRPPTVKGCYGITKYPYQTIQHIYTQSHTHIDVINKWIFMFSFSKFSLLQPVFSDSWCRFWCWTPRKRTQE